MSRAYGLVFDFDGTLASDSTSGFLAERGVDVAEFWDRCNERTTLEGWDPIPAYLAGMIELSRKEPLRPITREALIDYGRRHPLYEGVEGFFDRVRKLLAELDPGAELEFFLISSGLGELLHGSPIASEFRAIWGCEFSYGPHGEIDLVRNSISFTEKTRYLFHISKEQIEEARSDPDAVNRRVPRSSYRIPFRRMIYVGDGMTDVPCFTLVSEKGGEAIGVLHKDLKHKKWKSAWGLVEERRVSTLLPADYGPDAPLEKKIRQTLEQMALREQRYESGQQDEPTEAPQHLHDNRER